MDSSGTFSNCGFYQIFQAVPLGTKVLDSYKSYFFVTFVFQGFGRTTYMLVGETPVLSVRDCLS